MLDKPKLLDVVALTEDLQLFADIRAGRHSWDDSSRLGDLFAGFVLASPLGRPYVDWAQAGYAQIKARLIELAPLPLYEARPQMENIEWDIEQIGRTRPITAYLTNYVTTFAIPPARSEARNDLAQLGLLIELHHAEHGAYPERLEEIAVDLGRPVPPDPFTGESYRYTLTDDGFLLYSLGENLEDNGGHHHPREGDLVWRGTLQPQWR